MEEMVVCPFPTSTVVRAARGSNSVASSDTCLLGETAGPERYEVGSREWQSQSAIAQRNLHIEPRHSRPLPS
jgi:hypothetical protein